MPDQRADFEYNGRRVHIDVYEMKRGKWSWDYSIDGYNAGHLRESLARSEGLAYLEADTEARSKIDQGWHPQPRD